MARKNIDVKYVKQLQQGDINAFEEIFRFYKDSIYYFSLTLVKNKADAEEVVQETFMQMLEYINTLEKPSSFHSWLHKIAYHKALNLYRKNSKNFQLDDDVDLENIIEEKDTPSKAVARNELIEAVKKEIESMPNSLVQIAKFRYFDNLTTREISEVMEIPEGTVKTRLNKIRRIIQPKLKLKGFSPAKYFSFAFTPLVFQSFQQLIANQSMSSGASAAIYESVSTGATIGSGVAAGGSLVAGATQIFSKGGSTAAKVATATVAGVSGVYGVYQVVQPATTMVEYVEYYPEMTNANLEIEVVLNNAISGEQISVVYNDVDVKFQKNGNKILFDAVENGNYTVKVDDTSYSFTIANIDKQSPELLGVKKVDGQLTFSFDDDISGIDFDTSYFETVDGTRLNLPQSKTIEGAFNERIKVSLHDKAGNISEYDVGL